MRYLRMVLVALACLTLPAAAMGRVVKTANGHRLSVMLRVGVKGGGSTGGRNAGGAVLVDHGGPVLAAEAPYVIYWTPTGLSDASPLPPYAFASSSYSLLNRYMGDVAHDSATNLRNPSQTNVYSVAAQYGATYAQTFGSAQAVIATDPYPGTGCALSTGMTACVSDASIQAEISKLIGQGALPAPTPPGTGTTPIFFVVTPVDVNVCLSKSQCVNNSFCAYHSYFSDAGQSALYASVPFSVFATSPKGCQTDGLPGYNTPVGSSGDEAYNIADDLSHELSETITDPLINAWYSNKGYEIGDLCEAYGPTADPSKGLSPLAYAPAFGNASVNTLYDQVINRDQYYNQTEYSNSAGGCRAGVANL